MACQGYQVTAGTANETYLDELENVAWFLAALWAGLRLGSRIDR
jgi:hypothetical protein